MSNPQSQLFNRELSWLDFNRRVLQEAQDPAIPLLERLKFLAITGSNLDEFFMVRVGSLLSLVDSGSNTPDPAGLTPSQQLDAVSDATHHISADQYRCFLEDIEPALAQAGVKRVKPFELTEDQAATLKSVFVDEIFSTLTPMAVEGVDDFPLLIGRTLNVCVQLAPGPDSDDEAPRFAIIPFGRSELRFVTLPSDGGYSYFLVEDAIEMFAQRFFPGETIVACAPFRITRNADHSVREDQASDLMSQMEEVLDQRKQSSCVRLEVSDRLTSAMRHFLQSSLGIADRGIYAIPGPHDLAAFMRLTDLEGFDDLKYESWSPQPSPAVDPGRSMFSVIADRDVLLYHPYESFDPVLRFIQEAADDPDVLAIKQTLYRTSRRSPVVAALERASEKGKNVTVVVELKARFDEARNIEWARHLEQAGVQVIYGVRGLKTHAKICIVVRREPQGIRRYVHFGTGNYNEVTARLYTDVSLMTCNDELGHDAISFFNAITGYSQPQPYRRIEAAPIGMRDKLLEMIHVEAERCRAGHEARIDARLNALVDPKLIKALYDASCAGVRIRLNVRGVCCLKPGVPELSENITVVSIVDRLLEHARILYFHHGGDERVFISSADWMPRNLDRRVELMVPVTAPNAKRRLVEILDTCFKDTAKSRTLGPDGAYTRDPAATDPAGSFRSQQHFTKAARAAWKDSQSGPLTEFVPHRAPGREEP